jgi:hypothetical protein
MLKTDCEHKWHLHIGAHLSRRLMLKGPGILPEPPSFQTDSEG